MSLVTTAGPDKAFVTLRRLAQPNRAAEKCEFCGGLLSEGHRHLLELAIRKIICACDPCALRFENVVGRWKLIPRDIYRLEEFLLTEEEWDGLGLPIQLTFLFYSTPANRMVAMYPSPAGATESLLPLTSWQTLANDNPCLVRMQPDVEALLINRTGSMPEYYMVPIDRCFALAGLIRLNWRGFSGGDKVWQEIRAFFGLLREQAAVLGHRNAVTRYE